MDDSEYPLVDALGGFTMQDVGSGVLFFTEVTLGVSRPIYVNVDTPNLGCPYFLGGYHV